MVSIPRMPPSSPGDLSAAMALLGLLAKQPDTGAGVAVRLSEQFPRAGWSRNVAHNNLPSLERQGLVRVVSRDCSGKVSLHRYEATAEGVAKLRGWIRESAVLPPVLRDELQGKIEFSIRDDLRVLIREIGAEEVGCAGEYARAHTRHKQAQQLRHRRGTKGGPPDLEVLTREVQIADEAVVWSQRAKRLQGLREHIEDVLEEIEGSGPELSGSDDE
jgi:DNA-binding PadR family transcriptional regulator